MWQKGEIYPSAGSHLLQFCLKHTTNYIHPHNWVTDLRSRAVIVYCTWNDYLTNALTVIYCIATVEYTSKRPKLRACVNILMAIFLYSYLQFLLLKLLSFHFYDTYLLFRAGDILETEKLNLLNCGTGNHLVHLVTINTISFDHVMWKCVSPEESITASSLSRSYYTELQAFPLSPFPSSATRPLSIDTAEIIFPFWKRGPFPKYMSFSPGTVQHVFSFDFLVVSVLF